MYGLHRWVEVPVTWSVVTVIIDIHEVEFIEGVIGGKEPSQPSGDSVLTDLIELLTSQYLVCSVGVSSTGFHMVLGGLFD